MTPLRRHATLALLTLTLAGCAEPETYPVTSTVTTSVTTTRTTQQVVSLRIGMKGSEAVAQAGIPCSAATLQSIEEGANVTLNYQGRSYVFSKGVLEAVH
jgi:carbohydrate-binding DOMON domain-containing protein